MVTSLPAARSQSVGSSNTPSAEIASSAGPRHRDVVPSLGRWLPEGPMPQNLARVHGVNVNCEHAEVFQQYRVVA
jgi:hypothetical protein